MKHVLPILAMLALWAPVAASAYSISKSSSGAVVRWDHADLTYKLDPSKVDGIAGSTVMAEIHEGFADWQDVSCSKLTFEYLGETNNKDVLPISLTPNGVNELVWINNSDWTFGKYVLGVTLPLSGMGGLISEADIAFNDYLQTWSIGMGWSTMDIKSVAIHEIGHYWGAQHNLKFDDDDPPTMSPYVDPYGRSEDLNSDDMACACFLYPATGNYYTCTKTSQCPYVVGNKLVNGEYEEYYEMQLTCSGGYCVGLSGTSPESVDFGGLCRIDEDCSDGNDCVTLDSGTKMCSTSCVSGDASCPSGFLCNELESGAFVCSSGVEKLPQGSACTTSTECETDFCFPNPNGTGTFCRIACRADRVDSCPDGYACQAASGSAAGGCFPVPPQPNVLLPVDSVCTTNDDCESGICIGPDPNTPRCRAACDLLAPDCPDYYHCEDVDGVASCLGGSGPSADGKSCTADEKCLSGHCVADPITGTKFCRTLCSLEDWVCPSGTTCVGYEDTDTGVCRPSEGKSDNGTLCDSHDDCITGLCLSFDDGETYYCTQMCLDGWCPEGMTCDDGTVVGNACSLDGSDPVEPEDIGTSGDSGTGGDVDAAVVDSATSHDSVTSENDQGDKQVNDLGSVPVPIVADDGCSGTPGNSANGGVLMMMILLVGVWTRVRLNRTNY